MGLTLSQAPSSGSSRLIDNNLSKFRDSLATEILDFSDLAGISRSQLLDRNNHDPRILALRSFCLLTKTTMTRMNESCPGLPPDSIENTLKLVTQKGAKVVMLSGVVPKETRADKQILGYGIMMAGRDNIIDAYHIPKELLQKENACRVIRLFVTDTARKVLPRGEAFNKIIDQIKILSADGLLIGMILTGIKDSKENPAIWLEAAKALTVRGFRDTGKGLVETVPSKNGKLDIEFEWWTWSKEAGATEAELKLAHKVSQLEHYKQLRLAALVPFLPLTSGFVSVHGRDTHSYDIARAYPGNLVIAAQYGDRAENEISHNLIRTAADQHGIYVPDNSLDSSVIMGAMPDILRLSPELKPLQAARKFFINQLKQLKEQGTLFIRDTVAPEEDKLIRIDIASREAQIFRDFIAKRTETHISQENWSNIKSIRNNSRENKKEDWQSWIAPLSVVMEFMDKFRHPSEEQSKRLYTAVKPSQIREILQDLGCRILYDAADSRELYEQKTFKGVLELFDLNGEKIKYPPLMHLTIAEKVKSDDAVQIVRCLENPVSESKFLSIKRYEKVSEKGELLGIQELVERRREGYGNLITLDVLPHFFKEKSGTRRLYFAGRIAPRPLISLNQENANPFHLEQAGAIFLQHALQTPNQIALASKALVNQRVKVDPSRILKQSTETFGYSRPDAIDERVIMQAVETDEQYFEGIVDNQVYDLKTRPTLRTFEASQFLMGCQRGIFQDRRLELMVYQIALASGADIGKWLFPKLQINNNHINSSDLQELLEGKDGEKVTYRESTSTFPPQFSSIVEAEFSELDAKSNQCGSAKLEYIKINPALKLTNHSITTLPLALKDDEIYAAVELWDFPAVFKHTGKSALLTIPTIRVPENISEEQKPAWVKQKFKDYYDINLDQLSRLGSSYLSSPGIDDDTIQPMIASVSTEDKGAHGLHWVKLKDLLENASRIECMQLRNAVYRAAHMYLL